MENSTPAPLENTGSFPLKRLPKTHTFALAILALAVLILPLAVVAAQLTTNLSSKAYTPTKTEKLVIKDRIQKCVGSVEDISYETTCRLSIKPTPPIVVGRVKCDPSTTYSGCPSGTTCISTGTGQAGYCTPSTTPAPNTRIVVSNSTSDSVKEISLPDKTNGNSIMGYRSATVICAGGYTQRIDLNSKPIITERAGTAVVTPTPQTDTSRAEAADTSIKRMSDIVAEPKRLLGTGCFSSQEITALATDICTQHPICPTPTQTITQTCKTVVQKYSYEFPCVGPVEGVELMVKPQQDVFEGRTGSDQGITTQTQSYGYINFTCPDGSTQRSSTAGACSSTSFLSRYAESVCQSHLILQPVFGNKCSVSPTRILYEGGQQSVVSNQGGTTPVGTSLAKGIELERISGKNLVRAGSEAISFTCPDGVKSDYKPGTCMTQEDLKSYANSFCRSHLVCPEVTLTPAPRPTSICTGKNGTVCTLSGCEPCPSGKVCPAICKLQTGTCQNGQCVAKSQPASTPPVILPIRVTPTLTSNTAPSVRTVSLISGIVGKTYSATITAKDSNPGDNLYMTISGLPFGIYQGPCTEITSGIEAVISCSISGTAIRAGSYSIGAVVQDDKGLLGKRSLTLTISAPVVTPKLK